METDKQGAFIHFQRRCRERFGITLNNREIEQIGQLCHDGSYSRILEHFDGVGLYRVRMGKEMAAVVYDRNRETVLTIMPIAWTSRSYKIERIRLFAEVSQLRKGASNKDDGEMSSTGNASSTPGAQELENSTPGAQELENSTQAPRRMTADCGEVEDTPC